MKHYAMYHGTQNGYGQEDFKIYNVHGGILNKSTVAEQTLNKYNIPIGNPDIVMEGTW